MSTSRTRAFTVEVAFAECVDARALQGILVTINAVSPRDAVKSAARFAENRAWNFGKSTIVGVSVCETGMSRVRGDGSLEGDVDYCLFRWEEVDGYTRGADLKREFERERKRIKRLFEEQSIEIDETRRNQNAVVPTSNE